MLTSSYPSRIVTLLSDLGEVGDLMSEIQAVLATAGITSVSFAELAPGFVEGDTDGGDDVDGDAVLEFEAESSDPEDIELMDITGVAAVVADASSATRTITVSLEALSEIVVQLAWLDGVSLVIQPGVFDVTVTLTDTDLRISFTTGMALRLDADLLVPVRSVDDWASYEIDSSRTHTQIDVAAMTVDVDSAGAVSLSSEGALTITDPVMIGETGVVIESAELELNLDGSGSVPEGSASGWRGLLIQSVVMRVPELFQGSFTADGLGFGSNGVSGTIGSTFALSCSGGSCTGDLAGEVFGMAGGVSSISLLFQQNILPSGSIAAQVYLPFFDADEPLHLDLSIATDGSFLAQLAAEELDADGLKSLSVGSIGTLALSAIALGSEDGVRYIELSGTLAFADIAGIDLPDVSVDGLRITSDGKVSMPAGGLSLQSQETIDLHGFQLQVDSIGFGTEGSARYVSFSGGVKLTDGLPIGVSATGLRIYWSPGGSLGDVRVALEGIGVEFEIPNTLRFSGEVSYVEREVDGNGVYEFEGDIDLTILPLDLAMSARLIVGENESGLKYFLIEVDAPLPMGWPLGSTGLALYGFSGFVASNMEPKHDDSVDFNWYDDWYRDDQEWTDEAGAFGLGVGTTLGTFPDNGFTFATKVAFVIVFPGPLVMLQGTGNLLRKRSELSEDPSENVFSSLIVFDGQAATLLAALSLQYQIPSSTGLEGLILDAEGTAEAFCDFNDPDNLHIYLGEKDEDKRIRAVALKLFKADAYLMLDTSSLKLGASIGFDEEFGFKVVAVILKALLAGDGEVTWAPQHVAGDLVFEGEFAVRALKFEMGLSVLAAVAAAMPHDFSLSIDLELSINLPWPLDDLSVDIALAWSEEHAASPVSPVWAAADVRDYKSSDAWSLVLRTDIDPSDHDDAWFVDSDGTTLSVPLDSRAVLSFNRNVYDDTGVGLPSPNALEEEGGNDSFTYRLSELALDVWNGESWEEVPDLVGSWQSTGDEAGTVLEFFGDGPFSYARDSASGTPVAATPASVPATPRIDSFLCLADGYPLSLSLHSVDFTEFKVGQNVGAELVHGNVTWSLWRCETECAPEDIVFAMGAQTSISLRSWISKYQRLDAVFPEPAKVGSVLVCSASAASVNKLVITAVKSDGTTVSASPIELLSGQATYPLDETFEDVVSLSVQVVDDCAFAGLSWIEMSMLREAERLREQVTAQSTVSRRVLAPFSDYRIKVTTRSVSRSGSADETPTRYAFFRTSGPPDDLTPYVDRTVLSNDGNPQLGAYDLQWIFNENYMDELYGSDLSVRIYDENGDEVDVAYAAGWRHTGPTPAPYYLGAWWSAVGVAADGSSGPVPEMSGEAAPDSLYAWLTGESSLPAGKKLEVAILNGERKLWSGVLSTSKYADFAALVADLRAASWSERLADDADLGFAVSEEFDTIWYDFLRGSVRSRPERPEVTALADTTGAIRALLFESPEPIDWDRIEFAVEDESGSVPFDRILSADGTRALLIRSGVAEWASGTYRFSFAYRLTGAGLPSLYRRGSTTDETPAAVSVTIG